MKKPGPDRILYMEDNPETALLVKLKLAATGYSVDIAPDGKKGLAMHAEAPYDVLLVDHVMPEHDGLKVIEILSERGPMPPTIMVSGRGSEKIAVAAIHMGASDYIVKDSDFLELLPGVVQRAWERKQLMEDKERMQETLRFSEHRFRIAAESTSDLIYEWHVDSDRLEWYGDIDGVLGLEPGEFPHTIDAWLGRIHPEDRTQLEVAVERHRTSKEPIEYEYRIKTRDGTWRTWADRGTPIFGANGDIVRWIGACIDITERKEFEEQLYRMSIMDELTDLYNRRGFLSIAEKQLKLARRINRGFFLLFADLDNLKPINDTFGHKEGDRALRETGAILKNTFREADIIARIGGDEFAVLCANNGDGGVTMAARRLKKTLDAFNRRNVLKCKLSMSIGSALWDPLHPSSVSDLLVQADKSMYRQKNGDRTPRHASGS